MKIARVFAGALVVAVLTWAVAVRADDGDPSEEATPHESRTPKEHPTPHEHPTPPERETPGEHDRTPSGRPTPVDCTSASALIEAAAAQCSCDATNHGQYVSCVSHAIKQLDIPRQCKRTMASCSSRSTCGRTGAVTCQRSKPGACDTTSGTCVRGTSATGTCAANADCVATKCSIMSSADRCIAAGGSPGTGSCCAPGPLAPLPTSTSSPTPTSTATPTSTPMP